MHGIPERTWSESTGLQQHHQRSHLGLAFSWFQSLDNLVVAEFDRVQSLLRHSSWFSFTTNAANFHAARMLHAVK